MRKITALFLLLPLFPTFAQGSSTEPVRVSAKAFGDTVALEVRDLPRQAAEAALRAALVEVLEIEQAVSDPGEVASRLAPILTRGRQFCLWSGGAFGPLGGRLARLWGLSGEPLGRPTAGKLAEAVASARCAAIGTDGSSPVLAEGSELDLTHFAPGFAIDRAAAVLRSHGAGNGWIRIGSSRRGFGPGPAGLGWPVELPTFEGLDKPLEKLFLKDRALAIARLDDHPLVIGGDRMAPYLDQRTGQPAQGVVATLTVTELALDAQALSVALFILGSREGEFRVSNLKPEPSVLWLLGSGTGRPLLSSYRWSKARQ
ncbi:MAG: FAD:protein FMN transferase [Acidobacteriota bacterium]